MLRIKLPFIVSKYPGVGGYFLPVPENINPINSQIHMHLEAYKAGRNRVVIFIHHERRIGVDLAIAGLDIAKGNRRQGEQIALLMLKQLIHRSIPATYPVISKGKTLCEY